MKKIKSLSLGILMLFLTISLSSSLPASKMNEPALSNENGITSVLSSIAASKDKTMSYRELKNMAEVSKGSKLSLKEKIALKLFNKKLSSASKNEEGGKSQLIALLLVIFVGGLGIHRFYLGYTWQGIVQLLTGGGCGIWALIDLIRIITGDLQPKDGAYAKTL
jgi:hypothetical protein